MKFSVDAHAIGRHMSGNEVYVRSLLTAFASIDRDSEFIAYVSTPDARQVLPERVRTRDISGNPFVRLGWEMSSRLREDQPDLVHVQYTGPIACPVPVVASVHDVSFVEHPEFFSTARAWQLTHTVRRTVMSAARILTGSEFSRQSILRAYPIDERKVTVVHNAASPQFRPLHIDNAQDWVRRKFSLPTPFLLTVGDLQPRKNHTGLIQAFADVVKANPNLRHRLAIAGKDGGYGDKVKEAAKNSGVTDRIRILDWVTDDDLLHLYNSCDLFVFPSFYEGFGLPILEAMACGRAVACANTSAMPEVADGAALLFDPYNPAEIARAIADYLLNPELRIRMERLGQQRASYFSWSKTARETLDVYHGVAGDRRRAARPASAPVTR